MMVVRSLRASAVRRWIELPGVASKTRSVAGYPSEAAADTMPGAPLAKAVGKNCQQTGDKSGPPSQ